MYGKKDVVNALNASRGIDKYYVKPDCVIQIYYNPNSTAGGQFVINEFTFDLIKKALSDGDGGALEFLESACRQYCVDINDDDFNDELKHFISDTEDFTSDDNVLGKLKELVGLS